MAFTRVVMIFIVFYFTNIYLTLAQSGDEDRYRLGVPNDDEDDDCFEVIHLNGEGLGDIRSPGNPELYPDDIDCGWLLIAAPGDHVRVAFDDFDIEPEQNCQYDYISIYDGPDGTFPLIGRFCGATAPQPVISTNRHLFITFHSDGSEGGRGFAANYAIHVGDGDHGDGRHNNQDIGVVTVGCENTGSDGFVTSPSYPGPYPSNSNCTYVITIEQEDRVKVTFVEFDLEGYGCSFDYLHVRDGDSRDSDLIGTYCDNTLPDPLISSGNTMYMQFVSDGSDNRMGFKFQYSGLARTVEIDRIDHMSFTSEPENITLELTQSVTQHCAVDDNEATVTWYKDDVLLPHGETNGIYIFDGGLLVIPVAEPRHVGKYTCVAVNADGDTVQKHGYHVLYDVFQQRPLNAAAAEDGSQIFHCQARAATTIEWHKDDIAIDFSANIFALPNGDLLIHGLVGSDAGKYTCLAKGPDGETLAESSAWLTVTPTRPISEICGQVLVGADMETENDELEEDREADDNFRIVGGETSRKGSAPWMARLWDNRKSKHFCGGSVLNNWWVVTAAHCITKQGVDASTLFIRLGDYDDVELENEEILHEVDEIIVHPDYRGSTFDSDIALIRLANKVTFTDHILPVCLPPREVAMSMLKKGTMGRVLGWGSIREGGTYPRYLKEVELPVRRIGECRKSTRFSVTTNMFCAGYKLEMRGDSCKGDSGGPMVQRSTENKWQLVGIVSWGEGCAERDKFGFYTKVYKFNQWIQGTIRE